MIVARPFRSRVGAALGVVLAVLCLVPIPVRAGRIACAEPEFDFGERREDETVTHVFRIRNEGRRSLEIYRLRHSCGCTAAMLSESRLPPGGEALVEVALSLRGRRGRQRHHVTVESSDTRRPRLILALHGRVRHPVTLDPALVFFGRLESGAAVEREVRVSFESAPEDLAVDPVADAEWVEVSYEMREESAQEGRLTVRTRPPLPEGLSHATVRFRTGLPEQPEAVLPVGVFVPPRESP